MRKLFLISIVCSLLLAGCGGERKEPQAGSPSAGQSAASKTETGMRQQSPSPSSSIGDPFSFPQASGTDGLAGSGSSVVAASSGGILPAEIEIPDIGVDAKVVSLGLTDDGAMDVPNNDEDVGWFQPGYLPGVPGHSVMAGHVDSKTGPAVLFKLKTLKKGSKIIIRSKEGETRVFRVVGSESYPYEDAPLKEIFGPSDTPLLNLITCTGLYSRSKRTHQERLVVTAELESDKAS